MQEKENEIRQRKRGQEAEDLGKIQTWSYTSRRLFETDELQNAASAFVNSQAYIL